MIRRRCPGPRPFALSGGCASLGHASRRTAIEQQTISLGGHATLEQARRDPYLYLPFSVPAGTRRIHVKYEYGNRVTAPFGMGPGNTVDLGIFDSRGHEFLAAQGFRGWSGADRPEFTIAEDEATPGYIRGPLFPGEWNVLLGLARVEPEGVRYGVTVTMEVDPTYPAHAEPPAVQGAASATVPRSAAGPAAPGRGMWLKGDLHCHTLHSDGSNTVREMAERAVELGLDFLAVTDHNTNTHHEDIDAITDLPVTLIPGEEVTTYWGHANTWGLREWIEYRCAGEEAMKSLQRYLRSRDALFSINHPKCVGPPWIFKGWEGFQCMEVWQAPWRFYNWEALEKWDGLLQRGERVVAVGGSDTHSIPPAPPKHPHGLAEPTTWVYSTGRSEAEILEAIRTGRVYIADAPGRGASLALYGDADGDGTFEVMMGDTARAGRTRFRIDVEGGMDRRLWVLSADGPLDIIPLDRAEAQAEFTMDTTGHRYIRAELRGLRGSPARGEVVWAMTNPIWVEG